MDCRRFFQVLAAVIAVAAPAGACQRATLAETGANGFPATGQALRRLPRERRRSAVRPAPNQYDILHITGLNPGAQTITLSFSGVSAYTGGYYGAGGTIMFSANAFRWNWDGTYGGTYSVGYNSGPGYSCRSLTSSTTLTLTSAFTGDLYLGLANDWGNGLSYSVDLCRRRSTSIRRPASSLPSVGVILGTGPGRLLGRPLHPSTIRDQVTGSRLISLTPYRVSCSRPGLEHDRPTPPFPSLKLRMMEHQHPRGPRGSPEVAELVRLVATHPSMRIVALSGTARPA